MTRSIDLDTVAPDDPVETTKKVVKKKKSVMKGADVLVDKIYEIFGHTRHPLASLLVNPHVFSFEERAEGEKIVIVARPHWFTNVSWIISAVILFLAPSLLRFLPPIEGFTTRIQIVGLMTWYLVSFAFAFEKFLSWYFDVFIITDERVIDIDFNNLLDKKFSEAKIGMIQDVTSRVSGVSQTLFNYGTVFIQTASEVPEISFEKVANPEKIIKALQILREEEERETLEGRVK